MSLSEEERQSILSAVQHTGASLPENSRVKHIISGNLNHVLNNGSGLLRIQSNVINKFKFILSKPSILESLSSFEIRCCVCKRMITFPCWYHEVKYAVNHFHYFVCFSKDSKNKPNCNCARG